MGRREISKSSGDKACNILKLCGYKIEYLRPGKEHVSRTNKRALGKLWQKFEQEKRYEKEEIEKAIQSRVHVVLDCFFLCEKWC